jgi:molybdenum ABC transporter molybdate-binding protein
MAELFEKSGGGKVELAYDGSNRLLGQIKLTQKGDLYIAGDADYIGTAKEQGLVERDAVLCRFVPVIMVAKGNPKKIATLADMTVPGIRIGQADEKAAAIGRLIEGILKLNGVDKNLWQKNVVMRTSTVNELAMAIKLGTVDAVIVWDAVAAKYGDASEIIKIPADKNISPAVGAAVLSFSKHKTTAAAFLDFMTSDKGRSVLHDNGYSVTKP